MPLLTVLPHIFDLLCSMVANAWIITVWANDDVMPLLASSTFVEFRPGMRSATAKASQSAIAARRAAASCATSAMATLLRIASQGHLSLAGVCPYRWWCTCSNCPCMKGL